LKQTIISKDFKDVSAHFFALCRILASLDMPEDAAIAAEFDLKAEDDVYQHAQKCDLCDSGQTNIEGICFTCTHCPFIDLCSEHHAEYAKGVVQYRGCSGHKFFQIPRSAFKTLPPGEVNSRGLTRRQWLEALELRKNDSTTPH
jgi:hypothetical protein